MTHYCYSAEETQAIGRALGEAAQLGDIFLLSGEIGAGKTTFAQGFGAALGYDEVSSPTFVILHEHRDGRLPLYHFDLYRLDNIDDLGFDEYFYGNGVCLIEWHENAPQAFETACYVTIGVVDGARKIEVHYTHKGKR